MEAIFNSFFLVFASEMGDKTQLLALVLATKFRKPWTIMAGILTATLLNHGIASWAGGWLSHHIDSKMLSWGLAATFFIFAIWILIPDKDEDVKESNRHGAYLTTVVVFFLAEMGDKTQLATIALGATYANAWLVTFGTTLGMLCADSLAVFFGDQILKRISMKWIHIFTAILFVAFGMAVLVGGVQLPGAR
jgi:putative Ca2+/H+ antiporter (TMEM165/GDT1 family)